MPSFKRYIPKHDGLMWRVYDALTNRFPGGLSARPFEQEPACEGRCEELNEKEGDVGPL